MEPSVHFPGHAFTSIAVIVVAVLLVLAIFATRSIDVGPGRRRIVLLGLRVIAVIAVLGAWLQPGIRMEQVVKRKSMVPVFVDESASMAARDKGGATRAERTVDFINAESAWFDRLESQHDVRYFTFSDGAKQVSRAKIVSALDPVGASTDVIVAMRDALADVDPSNLGGIVFLTDGRDVGSLAGPASGTFQDSLIDAIHGVHAPVFVIMPPDPKVPADLSISDVRGLKYILGRDLAQVDVLVTARGIDRSTVNVTLKEDGQLVDSKTVSLIANQAQATLTFLPKNPGRHVYEVAVEPDKAEVLLANNIRLVQARIVRDRLRILHVAGHASWDQRFLREYLKNRRDVELVSFHTLRAAGEDQYDETETTLVPFPTEELFMNRIEGFDLIILQDFELPDVDRQRFADAIARYVENGGAILLVGGSGSFGARTRWPDHLQAILPIKPPLRQRQGMIETAMGVQIAESGRFHPAMMDLELAMDRAPHINAIHEVGPVVEGCTPLISTVGTSSTRSRPMLVGGQFGQGRSAVLLTDTLWRWSFDADSRDLYRKLLKGLIGWLTRDPDRGPIRIELVDGPARPGRQVTIDIRIPRGIESVQALTTFRDPSAQVEESLVTSELHPDADGRALMVFEPTRLGVYTVLASTAIDGTTREAALSFVVAPTVGEVVDPYGATVVFEKLAKESGGAVLSMDSFDENAVSLRPEVVARVGVSASEPLWNHPLILALLIIVLALEWMLERRLRNR